MTFHHKGIMQPFILQVRLFPVLDIVQDSSGFQEDRTAAAELAGMQGQEFLWTAITPSGSLILAPRCAAVVNPRTSPPFCWQFLSGLSRLDADNISKISIASMKRQAACWHPAIYAMLAWIWTGQDYLFRISHQLISL